jgi:flagellar P-ring protein precursor FlgI
VATFAQADRIRDLTSVQGVRENSLIGYGLVVGLDGTGDQTTQTPFTTQSLNNMLSQLGITVPAGTNMQLKNVAAVVTASTRRLRVRGRPLTWWSPQWVTPKACAAVRC